MIKGERILITGASGLLGHSLCERLVRENQVYGSRMHHEIGVPDVEEVTADITSKGTLSGMIRDIRPGLIIHTAGLTNVDQCESDPALAELLNVEITREIALAANQYSAKLVHISTDHLFDGTIALATEETPIAPMNQYARTKAKAEQCALEAQGSLILRTNFFGPGRPWRASFSDWILNQLKNGQTVNAFEDVFFSPILISNLGKLLEMLVAREAFGIFNLVGSERISKFDFAVRIAKEFGFASEAIRRSSMDLVKLTAPRPKDMSLSVSKLEKFLETRAPDVNASLQQLKSEMAG